MNKTYILIFLFISHTIYSQVPEPVSKQNKAIILYNAQVHVGNGTIIEEGYVCFDSGKITHVGQFNNAILKNFENHLQIDLNNKLVYPGLILPISKVGLEEISAIRATLDHTEIGDINSNIRTLTSYNTDSEMISTFRYNGILLSQVAPDGDLITGNSSVMMMEGWNWEDAAYKIDNGIHIKWPRKTYPPSRRSGSTEFRTNSNYNSTVDKIHKFLINISFF